MTQHLQYRCRDAPALGGGVTGAKYAWTLMFGKCVWNRTIGRSFNLKKKKWKRKKKQKNRTEIFWKFWNAILLTWSITVAFLIKMSYDLSRFSKSVLTKHFFSSSSFAFHLIQLIDRRVSAIINTMLFVDIVIKFPAFFYLSSLKLDCTGMTTVTKRRLNISDWTKTTWKYDDTSIFLECFETADKTF